MGNVLDGREQISLMDIDPKLSRPLLRVATITRVLTLPGLVPAEGLKTWGGGTRNIDRSSFDGNYFTLILFLSYS